MSGNRDGRYRSPVRRRHQAVGRHAAGHGPAPRSATTGSVRIPPSTGCRNRVAELTGKDAALYLPTGTMCNQIAMHAFVRSGHLRGLRDHRAHRPGRGRVGGGAVRDRLPVPSTAAAAGSFTPEQVDTALAAQPRAAPRSSTWSRSRTRTQVGGGAVMGVAQVQAIAAVCAPARQAAVPGRRPDLQRVRGHRGGAVRLRRRGPRP